MATVNSTTDTRGRTQGYRRASMIVYGIIVFAIVVGLAMAFMRGGTDRDRGVATPDTSVNGTVNNNGAGADSTDQYRTNPNTNPDRNGNTVDPIQR